MREQCYRGMAVTLAVVAVVALIGCVLSAGCLAWLRENIAGSDLASLTFWLIFWFYR
jgi:hypothetical protein